VRDFGKGIYSGLTGIVAKPIEGAKQGGAKGLLKGIGKGVIGLPLKPTIGAIDLLTRTGEGIKNNASLFEQSKRKRNPRYFGPDGVLDEYDPHAAVGQTILSCISDGKYSNEWYMFHEFNDRDEVVLASDKRVLLLKKSPNINKLIRLADNWSIKHNYLISQIYHVGVKGGEEKPTFVLTITSKSKGYKEKQVRCDTIKIAKRLMKEMSEMVDHISSPLSSLPSSESLHDLHQTTDSESVEKERYICSINIFVGREFLSALKQKKVRER